MNGWKAGKEEKEGGEATQYRPIDCTQPPALKGMAAVYMQDQARMRAHARTKVRTKRKMISMHLALRIRVL